MRKMVIFEKYELNEIGYVTNIKTGNQLKVETGCTGRFVKLSVDGKTKRVNIQLIMDENFPEIVEEIIETPIIENQKNQKKLIRITQNDGQILEFKNFKSANDHYGLRKDYLNYCISEKFSHMLTKGDLDLKSVEKIQLI